MEIGTYPFDQALAAADALGWQGECVAVDRFEAPLVAIVLVDGSEHLYRDSAGVKAICDLAVIADLLELPYRSPVPTEALPPALIAELRRLPEGVVGTEDRCVERLVRRPLTVVGTVAERAPWGAQAEALGRFVTTSPRAAIREPRPGRFSRVATEAMVWGIGLVTSTADGLDVFAAPADPTVEVRPYEWWLAEVVYDAWCKGRRATATPTPRSAA